MDNWTKTTLGKISKENRGYYGIGAPSVDYDDNLYTYLRITDINDDGTINKYGLKSVNEENAEKYLLEPNDIVFARTGKSTGRSYFYDGSDGEFVYAGFLIKFSLDEQKVNPKYMKYYTLSNKYKGWVKSFNTGSTRGNINANTYANMEISLPPRYMQDKLVAILSSLDDKIENNRLICEKLEELAQVIFKQWFVEERTDEWEEYSLYELMDIMSGGTPKTNISDFWDGNIPFFTPKDADTEVYCMNTEKKMTTEGLKNCNSKLYETKTVFITARGTVGKVSMAGIPMAMNQSCYALKGKQNLSQEFIYLILKSSIENFIKQSHGAVFNSIIVDTFKNIKTWLPPLNGEKIKETESILCELFNIILVKQKQNIALVKTRDTLLPKLMGGEIDMDREGANNE